MVFVSTGMNMGGGEGRKGRKRGTKAGKRDGEGNSMYHKILLETWNKYYNCSIKKKKKGPPGQEHHI